MMNAPIYNQNSFLSMKKYEAQNLSYSVLKDTDFHKYSHTVSFFRSDFRGTKFENVSFYKNNLDRSDFLNAVFLNSSFEKVNFGCCQIKNCYIENGTFKNNLYRNTSIHSTTFVNCIFPDESFLINMQHCELVNCKFVGCNFEMSTTDSNVFKNCNFINTNLATMHAENHIFIKCNFDNIYMDSSYFFGYSITKCDLKNIIFLYRGEYVNFDSFNLDELINTFKDKHQYSNLINLLKYTNKGYLIPNIIEEAIAYYKKHPYGRMLDIIDVINALIFSAQYEEIDFNSLYITFNLLNNENWDGLSFLEKNEIKAMILKFQNALFLTSYSNDYLYNIDQSQCSLLTIVFTSDDYNLCLKKAEALFRSFLGIKCWELIDKKQGSWILTFALPTFALVYILPRIIKNYSDVYFDIKTKKALSKKLLDNLNKPNLSTKQIEKIESNIVSAQLLLPSGKCINESDIKDIQSFIANV